jgi:acetyl esterase/lipase
MTDYLIASTPRRIAWLSLLLVVTTLFAKAEAAMPPQLAVSNVSVIDPITAEASLQSTTAEFYAGASIDEGLSYVSCVDPLDSVDLESSLVVENDHVGSAGSIYVVAIVGEESYMLVGDVFYPWDGLGDSLEAFATKTLQATETINILDQVQFGPAGVEQGELAIYIGYQLVSDLNKIYFSATPLRVKIEPGAVVSRNQYVGVDSCSPYAVKTTSAIVYDTGTITYPATEEFELLLDLYAPDVDLSGKSVPSIVIIHGGGFKGGTRTKEELVDYAERFAAQGYLAISIDYRVSGQVPELNSQFASLYTQLVTTEVEEEAQQALGMFSAMEDSLKAMAWLENYAEGQGFEISALGLLGSSAGGITSLNVGYGLNDYGFSVPEFKVVVNHWGNLLVDQESGKPSITAGEAALISVHGTEDPTVLYSGSVEIHARADEIGLTHELITSEGAGHGFSVNRLWDSESFEGSGYTKGERILNFVNAAMQTPSDAHEGGTNLRILSVYHGLDPLPAQAITGLCGMAPVSGQDGMPVVFSAQINGDTLSPTAFAVEISSGERVTPLCVTLRPALEPLEQRTVLLIGPFSPEDSLPVSVEIVDRLEDVDGNSLVGLRSEEVTALASGPSLVLAERFAPNTSGLEGECPADTAQAIQLTWEGGVSGPAGADLEEAQRTAISILLDNGNIVHPIFLADDDPDNHVIACVAETSPALSVSVAAGFFHDPGDDANPETRIGVISRMNE